MPQYLQLVTLGDQQFEPLSGPGYKGAHYGVAVAMKSLVQGKRPSQTSVTTQKTYYTPCNTESEKPRIERLGELEILDYRY